MTEPRSSRRTFLSQSSAAIAAAAATPLVLPGGSYAAGADTLKVGLIGCGGRGTGAAEQALTADKGVTLYAMGDVFADQIESSLSTLKASSVADRVDVPQERRFVGFDAFKQVVDACDVVLLASTPHFRPIHFAYAVEKGRHCFVEKPVATDAPGVRAFLKAADEAKAKGLSVASGLCWRYDHPRRETIKRVRDGAVGDIVTIETIYNSGGVWEPRRERDQVKSDMEYQMRNWYYYDWLSGDHIVEQAVHGIDTMAWVMGDVAPLQCWGTGGRQVRTDPKYGNIYDHFAIVYEYENGVRGFHHCRHWRGASQQTKDYVLGSKGTCDVFANRITGADKWRYSGPKSNMYQVEHDELFASIRSGKPKNEGHYTATTTLLAIMGRMAAYTGQTITWDMALNSQENLAPAAYAWDAEAPKRPVPVPGLKEFV